MPERDCGPTAICKVDETGLGGCEVNEDLYCELDSDCAAPLVCHGGACANECATEADCPAGAMCEPDDDGALGCTVPGGEPCVYNHDCPIGLVCNDDQRCVLECREARDCEAPRECIGGMCMLPGDGSVAMDGAP